MAPHFDPLPEPYRSRLAELHAAAASVGLVLPGTVLERYMPCGKPSCRCQGDPPVLHGPYWQWTRKVDTKTRTVRLQPDQARLYRAWTANRRSLEQLIADWDALGLEAAEEILKRSRP